MLKEFKIKEKQQLQGIDLKEGDLLLVEENPEYFFKKTETSIIPLGIRLNVYNEKEYLVMIDGHVQNFQSVNESKLPIKKIKETFEYMLYHKMLPPLTEDYVPIKIRVREGADIKDTLSESKILRWLNKNTK